MTYPIDSDNATDGDLPACMEWAGDQSVRCRCGARMDMSVAHEHDCEHHDPFGRRIFEQFGRATATPDETGAAPDTTADFD